MRATDVIVAAVLHLSRSPYDSAAMATFDVLTAALAIWLRANLVSRFFPVAVISSLCGVLLVLSVSRIVLGIALSPRFAGTPAGAGNPVYGNNLAQQITSTFDAVLSGLALCILVWPSSPHASYNVAHPLKARGTTRTGLHSMRMPRQRDSAPTRSRNTRPTTATANSPAADPSSNGAAHAPDNVSSRRETPHNSHQPGRPGSSDPTTPGNAPSPHRPSVPGSNHRPAHRKFIALNPIRESALARANARSLPARLQLLTRAPSQTAEIAHAGGKTPSPRNNISPLHTPHPHHTPTTTPHRIALSPRIAGTPAGAGNPVYGNNLAQQITSTFDVALSGLPCASSWWPSSPHASYNVARPLKAKGTTRSGLTGVDAETTRLRTHGAAESTAPLRQQPPPPPRIHRPTEQPTRRIDVGSGREDATQQLSTRAPRIFRSDDARQRPIAPRPTVPGSNHRPAHRKFIGLNRSERPPWQWTDAGSLTTMAWDVGTV